MWNAISQVLLTHSFFLVQCLEGKNHTYQQVAWGGGWGEGIQFFCILHCAVSQMACWWAGKISSLFHGDGSSSLCWKLSACVEIQPICVAENVHPPHGNKPQSFRKSIEHCLPAKLGECLTHPSPIWCPLAVPVTMPIIRRLVGVMGTVVHHIWRTSSLRWKMCKCICLNERDRHSAVSNAKEPDNYSSKMNRQIFHRVQQDTLGIWPSLFKNVRLKYLLSYGNQ